MASSVPSRCPGDLVSAIRDVTRQRADWQQTEELVARALRRHLPGPDILTAAERAGHAGGYRTHLLHTEPDGSFSVLGLVWRPGQATVIHDHVTWGACGVVQGSEHEELFALREGGTVLEQVGENENLVGDVVNFTPPGDIHRVRNQGDESAISLHVYGADLSRLGSSVRRVYDLPVLVPAS
jgi:predicted metal-dependent enzyme (double-stranded beta helix superfamily)